MEVEITSLKRRAEIVRKKLQILREQAAVFATGARPVHLLIQIEETEKELMEIEGQLKKLDKHKRVNIDYKEKEFEPLKGNVKDLLEQIRELKKGVSGPEESPREVSRTIVAFFSVLLSITTAIVVRLVTNDPLYAMYGFLATLIFCGFTCGVFTKIVIDREGKISIEKR